ncbi:hypothetical protein DFJ73DRAFT_891455 [Zopfochytrium polystomum]|nr:hypothetical protein DFJ73DRAFT_891455 [Zopfochytrium polystomum]
MAPTTATFNQTFEDFLAAEEVSAIRATFSQLHAIVCGPDATANDDYSYERLRAIGFPAVGYKRKALFGLLDAKREAAVRNVAYAPLPRDLPRRPTLVVSGAGPVGLRAAVEAAIVGFDVRVVELRADFSRHNVIKTSRATPSVDSALTVHHTTPQLGNYMITDLATFGMSHYFPHFSTTGNAGQHLGIKEIQICLLKAALLLGVRVDYQTGVCGLVDPAAFSSSSSSSSSGNDGRWAVWTLPDVDARARLAKRAALDGLGGLQEPTAPELQLLPGEQDVSRLQKRNRVDYFEPAASAEGAVVRTLARCEGESERELQENADREMIRTAGEEGSKARLIPFDYLFVAEGESSRLIRHLGFDRKVWKFANMIGIVVNIDISPAGLKSHSSYERQLPEFLETRMAAKWKEGPLGKLHALGFDLENIEYLRSTKTHFFVCTIKKQTLSSCGIVRAEKDTVRELLAAENLDMERLRGFARHLGDLAGVPAECGLSARHGVQIFDFSCKGQCTDTMRRMVSSREGAAEALVLPVGDALQNPYWPQGLGVNRGFHTALDAVFACHVHASSGYDAAVLERATAFKLMEWWTLSENSLSEPHPSKSAVAPVVKSADHDWTVDPVSRYHKNVMKSVHRSDIVNKAPAPSLPRRYREHAALLWEGLVEGEE